MALRVLLVEDEPMWQQGIAALLETDPEIELLSIVDNADDAEVFVAAEHPDVVLVDWKIKGPRDGLELARSLAQQLPVERIILVTGSPVEQIPEHSYGYVPKSRIASELIPGIQMAMAASKTPTG